MKGRDWRLRLMNSAWRCKTPRSADQGAELSGCYCLAGDNLGHGAMLRKSPPLSYGYIASCSGCLDLAPGAVGRKAKTPFETLVVHANSASTRQPSGAAADAQAAEEARVRTP